MNIHPQFVNNSPEIILILQNMSIYVFLCCCLLFTEKDEETFSWKSCRAVEPNADIKEFLSKWIIVGCGRPGPQCWGGGEGYQGGPAHDVDRVGLTVAPWVARQPALVDVHLRVQRRRHQHQQEREPKSGGGWLSTAPPLLISFFFFWKTSPHGTIEQIAISMAIINHN